jgi:addiction module HigA family antidote
MLCWKKYRNTMNNTTPYIATHPGELMRDEMRERGLTQRQLASLAGLTPSMVSALVNARCNVTEDIAAALEKALGIPVVMWMNLQSQYDHDLAEQANMRENVVVTIPVSDRNLLRDLSRKFGWACMM